MPKLTKQNKDFTALVDGLNDLSDRNFREAIRISRQFRRAQRSLARALERQQREAMLPRKATANAGPMAGVDYELA